MTAPSALLLSRCRGLSRWELRPAGCDDTDSARHRYDVLWESVTVCMLVGRRFDPSDVVAKTKGEFVDEYGPDQGAT
eukprot:gene55998-29420_t